MSWRDWSSWSDLYRKWVELYGEREVEYRCKLCGEIVQYRPEHLEKKHPEEFATYMQFGSFRIKSGAFSPVISSFDAVYRIGYAPEYLKAVYEWLMREAGDHPIEELHVDLLLEPSMTYEDAKKVLKSVLEKPLNIREVDDLIKERMSQLRKEVEELR